MTRAKLSSSYIFKSCVSAAGGGSSVPGTHQNLTQTGSTRRRHGKHPKSIWTTGGLWWSNTPEKRTGPPAGRNRHKPPPKDLGKAGRKTTLGTNENRRKLSRISRALARLGIFLTETPSSEAPTHFLRPPSPPQPPFSPPSGSLMSFLKHLPAKSNFLAKNHPSTGCVVLCFFSAIQSKACGAEATAELGLLLDSSGSVTIEDFAARSNGLAAAFRNEWLQQAIDSAAARLRRGLPVFRTRAGVGVGFMGGCLRFFISHILRSHLAIDES